MNELWAEVPDFPRYQVSTSGRVRSQARSMAWRFLKPCANSRGYLLVQLHRTGCVRSVHVHRLVAEVFLPREEGKDQVAHLDGTRTNNSVENLVWASAKENTSHKEIHGTSQRGERAGRVKLTDEQVRWVRSRPLKHGDQSRIARQLGVSASTINQILMRHTWTHIE